MKLSLLLLLPVVVLAQLTPNSVTVTASRNATAPSDLLVFNVTLTASPDIGFEDVLAAAGGAGLTAANFQGVNLSNSGPANWQFTMTAPLNNATATVGLLNAMQVSLAREKKFTLSFQVGGTDVSAPAQCPLADVFADARTQAATLASAAGVTVGPVQSLTGSTSQCSLTVTFAPGGPRFIAIAAQTPASNAAPTSVTVSLMVFADVSVGLDQIVQAIAPAGVSAADLLGVGQAFGGQAQWTFSYSAPLSKWKDTVAALARARDAKHPGVTVDYSVFGGAGAAPECAQPTLVSQARRRAQDVAAAAGVGVGPLTAVSDQAPQAGTAVAVFAVLSAAPYPWFALPGCSVVAQFGITPQ
jgi:hypothetical protein